MSNSSAPARPVVSDEILKVREHADCLYDMSAVERAVDTMAAAITRDIGASNPLVLALMTGGITVTGMLLQRLDFPLQVDYIHVSRYGEKTSGGDIRWLKKPSSDLAGRTVLIVDDLLDHGRTLQAAVDYCNENMAQRVLTAVLVHKRLAHRDGLAAADFFGLETPDRYLFGLGMDYKHYWRNAPGIFAVKD